jgi:prepilin-type N-terminal cleavage/methylation domain-containing protein
MKLTPLTQLNARRANAGFTLIELLVVVSIIALLAGGSVAAYGKVMNSVKKTASQKVCVEIASAVSSYFADYEKFPTDTTTTSADIIIDDTGSDGLFLGILNATGETQYNPRHIKYIDGMKQARFVNGQYVDGINFEGNEGAPTLTDPWGLGYKVIMDGDYDGKIDNPELDGSGAVNPPQSVRGKKCIIYGAGPDGNFQTWSDNPKSW